MVRHISDRMAAMYLGSLVEIGDADEVFFHPKHPYTKLLISSNPEPDPISERQKNRHISIGDIPSPINLPEGCRFASRCPEALDVCHKSRPELLDINERDLKKERLVACHLVTN